MDDESLGSDADREIAAAMQGSDPGRLSNDFQESLWDDIASELHRSPAAAGRSKISNHAWRRLGAVAAAIVLVAPVAAVLIARHTDSTDQISSSPNSSEDATDDSAETTATSSSAAPAATPDTAGAATSSTAATAETTTAPLTTAGTTASTTPSTFASLPDATDGSVDALPAIPGSFISSTRMIDATTGWVVTDAVLAHTEDAGLTWRTQPLPPVFDGDGTPKLGSDVELDFELDADHAWVARSTVSGNDVTITRSTDGAATIESSTVDPGFPLGVPIGLAFVDAMHGYLSIADPSAHAPVERGQGALFRTSDGGVTFQRIADLAPAPAAFDTPNIGWAAGKGLFGTTDGAATWTRLTPPGLDALGPDPTGPGTSYTIVTTSLQRTVIKVYVPLGMEAQVSYLATDDQGVTWTPVGPPDTSVVYNTGPQSTLTAVTPTQYFGIQQTLDATATLWQSDDGGHTYQRRALPFGALTLTMGSPIVGWATTSNTIRVTDDGGASWTPIANIIAALPLPNGCVWQPSFSGHEGAGQRQYILIALTNTGPADCAPPTVSDVSAYSAETPATVHATHGQTMFPLPALPSIVRPGDAVALQIAVLDPLEDCGNPPSRFVGSVAITISGATPTLVPLPFPIQTACSFAFAVGGVG
ncbi:MAG: hypothetical protein JWN39_3768 [Ilumatobacteraceae bacterium]|nr:hypothetical protein [Ilumatobacteraceae bacterium]